MKGFIKLPLKNLLSPLFFAVLFFGTAANNNLFSQIKTEDQKTIPADKAVVYFYSLKTIKTLGQVKKPIYLDDTEIASIRPERYFIVLLVPGNHNFRLKDKKFGGVEMEFEAGKTYYLKMGWQADMMLKPSGISLVQPESGAFDIKQLKPVDEKNIKDKLVVTTEIK